MAIQADGALINRLITATSKAIASDEDRLTRLDQRIGDADHGTNMKRGFDALMRERHGWTRAAWPDALHQTGKTLVLAIGGASGALYGSLLLGMASAARENAPFPEQFAEGIAWVKHRGRSDAGAKTLLDVLIPVLAAVRAEYSLAELRDAADRACAATGPMMATSGRAAYLHERSCGHIDPGAASSCLLVHAICDVLEQDL